MDVDHPAGEVGGDGEEMEKPRHHDQIGGRAAAGREDRLAPRRGRPVLPWDHLDRHPRPTGDVDATDPGTAGDDDRHVGHEPAGGDPVEEVLERPSGARKKDGEPTGRGHALPPWRRGRRWIVSG